MIFIFGSKHCQNQILKRPDHARSTLRICIERYCEFRFIRASHAHNINQWLAPIGLNQKHLKYLHTNVVFAASSLNLMHFPFLFFLLFSNNPIPSNPIGDFILSVKKHKTVIHVCDILISLVILPIHWVLLVSYFWTVPFELVLGFQSAPVTVSCSSFP